MLFVSILTKYRMTDNLGELVSLIDGRWMSIKFEFYQSDFQSGVNKQENQLTRFDGPKSGPVLS